MTLQASAPGLPAALTGFECPSCICNCNCTGDSAASAWPTYGYPWVVEVAKLVWQFVALWLCELTRRGIVAVGKFIVKRVKRRLESGWVFLKETFAKFRRRKLWGGYVDTSLTVEASVPPQQDTRINV